MSAPPLPARRWRSAWISAAALTLALACTVGRLMVDGRRAVMAARAAESRGEAGAAVDGYRAALRLYVPGAAHVRQAVTGLERLAADARTAADPDEERRALGALRGGLLGARGPWTPFAGALAEANARLDALTTAPTPATPSRARGPYCAPPPGPRGGAALAGVAGFMLAMLAATALALRGLGPRLQARPRPALAWGVVVAVGFLLFVVGMRLA